MKSLILYVVICLSTVPVFSLDPPARIHSVQVGAFKYDNQATAEGVKQNLIGESWSPVFIVPNSINTLLQVRVGAFESKIEAMWAKLELRKRGYHDAYEVSEINTKKEFLTVNKNPIPLIFEKTDIYKDSIPSETIKSIKEIWNNQNRLEMLQNYIAQNQELQNSGINLARIYLWRAQLLRDRSIVDEVYSNLREIADGTIPVSREECAEARFWIAQIYHYYKNKRVKAYHAYSEAMNLCQKGSELEANCLLERAAVMLELARDNIATFYEVRRDCEKVIENVPTMYEQQCAVSELMHAESWYFEHIKKNEDVLDKMYQEMNDFVKKYSHRRRESVSAYSYLGYAAAAQKDFENMEKYFRKATEYKLNEDEMFAWKGKVTNPYCNIAEIMIQAFKIDGRTSEIERWKIYLNQLKNKEEAISPFLESEKIF